MLTLGLIAVNVAVYIAMIASGASWISPTSTDALRFGADFGPLTLNGQWWRLFTSMFVHFGIIHIGLNMWCLWSLGDLAERVMSRKAFLFLYIASGLAGNIVSELWNPSRVSAGASGAVFGAAGGLVAFIYLKKAPISMEYATRRLKSLGIFIVYNLVYGMKAGVDNAAHIGGVLSGLAIGAVIPAMIAGSFGKAAGSEGGGGEVASAPVPPPLGGGNAAESRLWLVLLPSGPGYHRENTQQIMIALIHAARSSVVLTTPYFMPDDSFQLALCMAAERGVDVHLIVSRESNKPIVQLAQQSNYDRLLDAGVKIHLYHGNFLHAKHSSIDDCIAMIGSSNLDIRSFALNNEVSILIYDREVVAELGCIQRRYLAQAEQVDVERWRKRGIGVRVLQNLARLADSLI